MRTKVARATGPLLHPGRTHSMAVLPVAFRPLAQVVCRSLASTSESTLAAHPGTGEIRCRRYGVLVLRRACSLAALLLSVATVGCGSGVHSLPPPTTPPIPVVGGNISGNWTFQFTPASGTPEMDLAYGSIDQSGGTTTQGQFTTSVLVLNAPCYRNTPQVPLQGFATDTSITLNSFAVNQQFLGLTGTISQSGSSIAGNYTVTNGCADGAKGTLVGSRFAALTGTYAGAVSGGTARTLSLAVTQSTAPAGDGTFLLSGTATAAGFSCFTTATSATPVGGNVSGPTVAATFNTDEAAGSQLIVSGNFDLAAKTISNATYTVQGGACSGQTGTGTLALAQ